MKIKTQKNILIVAILIGLINLAVLVAHMGSCCETVQAPNNTVDSMVNETNGIDRADMTNSLTNGTETNSIRSIRLIMESSNRYVDVTMKPKFYYETDDGTKIQIIENR